MRTFLFFSSTNSFTNRERQTRERGKRRIVIQERRSPGFPFKFSLTCAHTHIYKGDLYSKISLQELFRSYYTPSPQKQKSSSLLSCSTSERSRIARKVKRQGFVMRGRVCVDKSNLTEKHQMFLTHMQRRDIFSTHDQSCCAPIILFLGQMFHHMTVLHLRERFGCDKIVIRLLSR